MSIALSLIRRPYVEFDFTRMAFDTRVSFSRSSTGTYFDAAGVMQTAASNTPRKEHNQATGAVRGLLVEEQRTNLLLRSQEFGSATWSKVGSSVPATYVQAPDATVTAEKVTESAASGAHAVTASATFSATTTYAFTTFAKQAGRSKIALGLATAPFGGSVLAKYDVALATVVSQIGCVAAVTQMAGGYVRLSLVATSTVGGGTSSSVAIYLLDGSGSTSYIGDGTSGAYVWGAQLEAGSYPTSYIPTTTATVTRSADVATFTIPPRVVRLVTIYDDGTTSQQAVTPGASYTIPTGQKPILRIRGYFA